MINSHNPNINQPQRTFAAFLHHANYSTFYNANHIQPIFEPVGNNASERRRKKKKKKFLTADVSRQTRQELEAIDFNHVFVIFFSVLPQRYNLCETKSLNHVRLLTFPNLFLSWSHWPRESPSVHIKITFNPTNHRCLFSFYFDKSDKKFFLKTFFRQNLHANSSFVGCFPDQYKHHFFLFHFWRRNI